MNEFLHTHREKLEDYGFEYSEEHSTDVVRWVYYVKTIDLGDSGCRLIVEITYEMVIDDNPSVNTRDNFQYFFDHIHSYFEDAGGTRSLLTTPRLSSLDDIRILDNFF
jgi:hypothetical protein